jgi:hypothetical protein
MYSKTDQYKVYAFRARLADSSFGPVGILVVDTAEVDEMNGRREVEKASPATPASTIARKGSALEKLARDSQRQQARCFDNSSPQDRSFQLSSTSANGHCVSWMVCNVV